MSDAQLYKQAGNAVTVNVVEAIARNLVGFDKEVNVYGKHD
jgi:DNA (cytosine-5)-methyltransferase 1